MVIGSGGVDDLKVGTVGLCVAMGWRRGKKLYYFLINIFFICCKREKNNI